MTVFDMPNHRRAVVSIDQARGSQPHQPGAKIGREGKDDIFSPGFLGHGGGGFLNDHRLFLSVAVLPVQLLGHQPAALRVALQQQAKRIQGCVHAPGGIQARAQHKANIARGELAEIVQTRSPRQRKQALTAALAQAGQPQPHQPPVFAQQRHHVRHRPQGH